MSQELVKQDHYMGEFEYAKKVGQMIVKSGKFAKDWNEDTVGILVLYAKDLGIHPVTALINGFDIIQGKISMKPILMSNMIRRKGHSISILANTNEECILKGKRKDTGDECTIRFGMDDAKRAGLASKSSFASWQSDMLYNRAMGRLGRMLFADVIGGAYTDGEMDDIVATSSKKKPKKEELQQGEVETIETPVEAIIAPVALTVDDLFGPLSLLVENLDQSRLTDFVRLTSIKSGWTEDKIIQAAMLDDESLNRFCDSYLKSLEKPA